MSYRDMHSGYVTDSKRERTCRKCDGVIKVLEPSFAFKRMKVGSKRIDVHFCGDCWLELIHDMNDSLVRASSKEGEKWNERHNRKDERFK